MSDIIRALNCCSTEQEQRQTQRAMARLTRAVRQGSHQETPRLALIQRPEFPAGIVPVFVINPPVFGPRRP